MVFVAGAFAIPGEAAYAGVGPRAVPILVGAALTLAGLGFAVSVVRGAEFPATESPPDRRALAWLIGGLVAAGLLIQPIGFALTAAVVFTATARAFSSRRLPMDTLVGLVLGAIVYVAFARGLGVSLPAGPLEWLAR